MKTYIVPALTFLFALQLPAHGEKNNEVFFSISRTALKDFIKPQDFVVLDKTEIADYKAGKPADLLDYLPSISVRKTNGENGLTTISMRGFSSKRTAVVIDDVKVPADLTGTVDISNLPLTNIEKLEIMPGAWSSVYGANAEGGVIHLFTGALKPNTKTAGFETTTASYGEKSCSARAGLSSGPLEVFFTGRTAYSDGFQQNSKSNRNSFTGKAAYDLGSKGKLTVRGFETAAYNGLPAGTPVPIKDWDGKKERQAGSLTDFQTSELNMLNAAYELPLSGDVELNVNSGLGNNMLDARQWFFGSPAKTLIKTQTRTASARVAFFGGSIAGVEYERNILRSPFYGDHSNKTWAFFSQNVLRPAPGVEVIPGLRYDANERYTSQLSPKLAVVYSPEFAWKFSAQAGKAWQAPTFADLYDPFVPAADMSANLKPERSIQSQVGGQWNSPFGFYLSVTGFYADIKDRIALDPAKSWAAYNLDSAFNSGFENEAGYKSGAFRASVAYSYILSKGKGVSGTYQLLQFSPKHRITSLAVLKSRYSDILVKSKYVSKQFSGIDGSGAKLPPYFTADICLSRKIGDDLEFVLGLDNIFNKHYAETADAWNGYYPQPGRVLRATVKISI